MTRTDIMWRIRYKVSQDDEFENSFFTDYDEAYDELRYLIEDLQAFSIEFTAVG